MKYVRFRDDGVIELRCGGELFPTDIVLTDAQYDMAVSCETAEALIAVINSAAGIA